MVWTTENLFAVGVGTYFSHPLAPRSGAHKLELNGYGGLSPMTQSKRRENDKLSPSANIWNAMHFCTTLTRFTGIVLKTKGNFPFIPARYYSQGLVDSNGSGPDMMVVHAEAYLQSEVRPANIL
jgi:hypothetical protein